jgi:hypothetical protein
MAARQRDGGRRKPRRLWTCEPLEERIALASAISVTSLLDTGNPSGTTSLRQAIALADADPGSTISFDPGLFASGPQVIPLGSGLPDITAKVTITGPGQATLTVQGGGSKSDFSILNVAKGATATVSDLTLSGANTSSSGGAINNAGNLTLTDCTLSSNIAAKGGGAIVNLGTLGLNFSTVSSNRTVTSGGGIFSTGVLSVRNSTISGNTAKVDGGGVYDNGSPTLLVDSTLYGNTAASGGGLFSGPAATVKVLSCTITANRAMHDAGGGVEIGASTTGLVTLLNTLVAGNVTGTGSTPGDALGALDPASVSNLIGDGDQATGLSNGQGGNQIGTAAKPVVPKLAKLADNGGPTQTVALLAGSPALDAGDNTPASPLGYDQRGPGFPRILNSRSDIGAFESPLAAPAVRLVITVEPPAQVGAGSTFRVVVTAENIEGLVDPAFQGSVTVSLGKNAGHTTLGGTLTDTAMKGLATFSDLDLKVAASGYTLAVQAPSTKLQPDTSTALTVAPLGARQFGFNLPATTTAGFVHNFTVTAYDLFGNVATGYLGTVHFNSNDSRASLPSNYTFTAGDAGKHTFSAALETTGTWGVRVRDTAHPTITDLVSGISVTPGAASLFKVNVPNDRVAGVPFGFTMTAYDAAGNLATGYLGTVHFTSSDTQAVLPADYTFTAADEGHHRFVGTLNTSGTSKVRASDSAHSSITGLVSGIVVAPAPAAQFRVSFPSHAFAGESYSYTVTAYDALGNVASGYLGTVHFTSNDPRAGLPANYTFTAADAGHHVFAVTLKTAGTWAVRASDAAHPSITGLAAELVVLPAAAAKVKVTTYPTATMAGDSHSFVVTLYDAFGNVASGYLGTITFSSDDAQALLPADTTFTASDAGTKTFQATFQTKGKHVLKATDTTNSKITGSEPGILVS